jgi:hypothetical protein
MGSIDFIETSPLAELHEGSKSYEVVLIRPGQGASAYYTEELIARDAPVAFPKGTHVYLGHTPRGIEPNPEKLLGTLVADTTIRESDGAAVNRFQPYDHWADRVKNVRKDVGLSINASGSATTGIVDGRSTKIAESIDYHRSNSVDMVSYAGAGGGFVESLFANVQPESSAPGKSNEGITMALDAEVEARFAGFDTRFAAIESLLTDRLPEPVKAPEPDADAERVKIVEAMAAVESAEVPASVKTRLVEGIKAGNYDVADSIAEATALREEVKAELKESGYVEVGAAGATGGAEAPVVKGWGH